MTIEALKRRILLTIILAAIAAVGITATSYFPFSPSLCGAASSDGRTETTSELSRPIYEKSWKLANDIGYVDWSPVDKNIFLVGTNVYCADGSLLYSIANDTHLDYFSKEKFSPDGSKIGYLYRVSLPNTGGAIQSPLSQIQIYDIENKTVGIVNVASPIIDYDWGESNNVVIYTTGSEILRHDIDSGNESTIAKVGSSQLDVTSDGKNLLYTQLARTVPYSECDDMFKNCVASRIFVMPVATTTNESKVIYFGDRQSVINAKWTSDGSAVTFATYPSFVLAGFPCGQMFETTKDGQNTVKLFPRGDSSGRVPCYNYGMAFNKDKTLAAYSEISGYAAVNPEDFRKENEGTYLSFTEACYRTNACSTPSKSIPIVNG
jgi:hypothetical protein